MDKLQGKIFLIQPFEESKYKKIIIYSDTPENARIAANKTYHSHDKLVYLNQNFSECEEMHPKIISIDNKLNLLKIEYEGVAYELVKNKPEEHIGGGLV